MPNVVFLTGSSHQMLVKSQTWVFSISRFLINPLLKEIAITPEPTSAKFDDEVMLEICDVIAIFPIYDLFGAIWKLNSGRINSQA